MSLVNYYSSSDDEETVSSKPTKSVINKKLKTPVNDLLTLNKPNLDLSLLSDTEDDKPKLNLNKGKFKSKLFDILPNVKPNRMPNTSNKTDSSSNKTKLNIKPVADKVKLEAKNMERNAEDEILNEVLFPIGDDIVDKYLDNSSVPVKQLKPTLKQTQPQQSSEKSSTAIDSPTESSALLPDEALRYLDGTRKRKHKNYDPTNIQIIDVNPAGDADSLQHFQATHNLPSTSEFGSLDLATNIQANYGARHNISFLANQAKSMEAQLQLDYARQRNLKKESRKKYGW